MMPYQYSPYQSTYQQVYQPQTPQFQSTQRFEVIKVSGKNGAEAFQMAPNSSILLLDETAPIVWLKTTDGAGYPTLSPYSITPYQTEQPIDTKSLEQRLERLEEIIYAQSNVTANESESNSTSNNSVTTNHSNVKNSSKS